MPKKLDKNINSMQILPKNRPKFNQIELLKPISEQTKKISRMINANENENLNFNFGDP